MDDRARLSNGPSITAIVGPTALGKTSVAVCLAHMLGGEIVSADSVAVYRGLDIGAAKPTAEERAQVRFHVVDVADPDEPFTVAHFKELALKALREIAERGAVPLVVGGTGLYVRVLLDDYGLVQTPADPRVRAELAAEADRLGAGALHQRLCVLDPVAAARIHPNDRVRIIRALEVVNVSGVPISELQARDAAGRRPLPSRRIGFTANREWLYRRINNRVDAMVAAGLREEVTGLLEKGYPPNLRSLMTLGYKEMVAHVLGHASLDETVDLIKRNTRKFAKRQLTWFRADRTIQWMDVTGREPTEVAARIATIMGSDAGA